MTPLTRKKKSSFLLKNLVALMATSIIIVIWWIFAETKFKDNGIIPSPIATLQIIFVELQKPLFTKAVNATLMRSICSFAVAFFTATFLATISARVKHINSFLSPFMTIFRAMPTMAIILILLMIVGSKTLPIVIAFLVVFPLSYENMYEAIKGIDKQLLQMARVFRVSRLRQLFSIYIPSILPYMFACIVSGFGLNLKVIIAAEIMGLPTVSIGYQILTAKQGFDFSISFAWLIIAVVLSYVSEIILRGIGRFLIPWKYPDQKNVKTFFTKLFAFFKNISTKGAK
ncbi:MAG: ABC transporter permease subunit [Christensenellaceae bacterium]|jgi:NitT/TauT family transport system permease protein|nr:ABC transporter permease subunit [Christensenellaceae bacterium]